ncbi:MAG: two-component system NarL family sensor kinase [Polaribacter sp.]
MKKRIRLLGYIFYISFSVFHLKAETNNKYDAKGVSFKETSLAFEVMSDSIFNKRFNYVLKLYQKEEHIEALKQALSLQDFIQEQEVSHLFLIKILIGDIYEKVNNHKRALFSYRSALLILSKTKLDATSIGLQRSKDLAKIYLKLGTSYQKSAKKDSATYYLEKIEALPSVNTEIKKYKARAFGNLAGIYQLDSLFDKALIYANKAIQMNREVNNKINEAIVTTNLGSIYLSQQKFALAKETYLSGIELLKNHNNQNAVRIKADLYYNLAWAMRNLKEYEAYDFQELSYDIEDNIRDKEYKRMIATIAAENDVQVIRKEEENKRLRQKTTFWVFIIVGVIIIVSFLLYWLSLYRLKQKNLSLKLSQTQLLQSQDIEKLKSESQIRILNATIDGKESERKDIAETLHDSVSALLSSANLHLIATKSQFKGKIPIEIDKTQSIIAEASLKIRDLSHTLVSSVLLKFGLNFALKDMAAKYSNSVLDIETDIYNLRRYNQNFEIKIYNIIQEFVNNILKHSKAKNTFIKLYEEDARICFQISDDGIGFDKTKIINKDSLGLNQIDARIHMMNGVFIINSTIGEGTIISVELPIVEKEVVNHV